MHYIISILEPICDIQYFITSAIIFIFVLIVVSLLRKNNSLLDNLMVASLITYLYWCYALTVLSRIPSGEITYEPYPFWSYYEIIVYHDIELLLEDILNIILLIPAGVLFSASHKKTKPKTIIVFAVVVELVIELSQLVSTRGLAEWDDIIHGAVGALIGYWIYRFVKEYIIKDNRDRVKIGYH